MLNSDNGKLLYPDNPFYDYEKAKAWDGDSPMYKTAFSIKKYLSRYKTLDDDGTTRLSVGSTAGSRVTNSSSYDVCTPTHIAISLGTNDMWLSIDNFKTIASNLLEEAKFNDSVKICWFIKRTNVVLSSANWIDRGVYAEGKPEPYDKNKIMQEYLYGLHDKQIFYLPTYYTQCICGGVNGYMAEDIDENKNIYVSTSDGLHGDVTAYYSIGHQLLSWIYYTIVNI